MSQAAMPSAVNSFLFWVTFLTCLVDLVEETFFFVIVDVLKCDLLQLLRPSKQANEVVWVDSVLEVFLKIVLHTYRSKFLAIGGLGGMIGMDRLRLLL